MGIMSDATREHWTAFGYDKGIWGESDILAVQLTFHREIPKERF